MGGLGPVKLYLFPGYSVWTSETTVPLGNTKGASKYSSDAKWEGLGSPVMFIVTLQERVWFKMEEPDMW